MTHPTPPSTIHLTRGEAGCRRSGALGAVAIVVDALRASATLAALFERGAARVLVTAGVEEAHALAGATPGAVLVGERGGERLPGFDLGNSPTEVLASPSMDGRTVVFTSSNGAQRLAAACGADLVLVGSPCNAGALAAYVRGYAEGAGRAVVCIAAGQYPDEAFVSPEDEATGAYLARRIGLPLDADSAEPYAYWSRALVLRGLEGIFRDSRHARRLMEIGYSDDVLLCARPDLFTAVPRVVGPVCLDGRTVGVELRALDA
jgi:2-phosphosulfolactate phosphatase